MMKVKFNFKQLLANKMAKEGEPISIREVSRRTEINMHTLSGIKNNTQARIDLSVIERLCDYLECKPGDLIVLAEDPM
jgi:DNA-binding Xre family transcriptional regulator